MTLNDSDTIDAIHDHLWDPGDPDADWDSGTIEGVADLILEARPGLLDRKRSHFYRAEKLEEIRETLIKYGLTDGKILDLMEDIENLPPPATSL